MVGRRLEPLILVTGHHDACISVSRAIRNEGNLDTACGRDDPGTPYLSAMRTSNVRGQRDSTIRVLEENIISGSRNGPSVSIGQRWPEPESGSRVGSPPMAWVKSASVRLELFA